MTPSKYLKPGAEKRYSIALMDLLVLLYNVVEGADTPSVRFEDADRTLEEMTTLLTANFARVMLKQSVVESALWSCNMMSESRKFWAPGRPSFREWLKKFLDENNSDFDYFFNTLEERKKGVTK